MRINHPIKISYLSATLFEKRNWEQNYVLTLFQQYT